MAEVPASKLVEAHGTFSTASCIRCHKSYDGEQIKVRHFLHFLQQLKMLHALRLLSSLNPYTPLPMHCVVSMG